MPRSRLYAVVLAALMSIAAAPFAPARAEPPAIVATTGMIADAVRAAGAECVAVTQMMGPGTDPHLYRASAGDVAAMRDADAIVYTGLYLEGQLGEVLDKLARRLPTLAAAEAGLEEVSIIKTGDGYGVDPHVWMDAALWSGITGPVAILIGELVPDCAEAATARAAVYRGELTALDGWIREAVATIPEGRRTLVTAHDAFAYFGRAYGVEVVGIQGVSTASEAGIADIRGVVDRMVDEDIPAIFVESTINPRTVEAVIAAAAEEGHELLLGPQLFSDAMGADGTPEGTYPGMLIANTRAIVGALGGTVPPLPEGLHAWAERHGVDPETAVAAK